MRLDATRAIERSASHDEVVTLDAFDEADFETLSAECDSSVLANGMWEFWADDQNNDEQMTWRVHMPEAVS